MTIPSKTGWPSFTQPIKENAVAYHKDRSFGMWRIEARCNTGDAHLGHVFREGPMQSGLRYCINAVSLKEIAISEKKVDFGGGCLQCTEAIFQRLKGVIRVENGYSGGQLLTRPTGKFAAVQRDMRKWSKLRTIPKEQPLRTY